MISTYHNNNLIKKGIFFQIIHLLVYLRKFAKINITLHFQHYNYIIESLCDLDLVCEPGLSNKELELEPLELLDGGLNKFLNTFSELLPGKENKNTCVFVCSKYIN